MNTDEEHLLAWIKAAGYNRHPFEALHAENDTHLEEHFTAHAGHFIEYAQPSSTVIVGARGSGKTANCLKLAEALRNTRDVSNLVLVYDASAARQVADTATAPKLKHHLHAITRCGVQQLLDTAAASLSPEAERVLRRMETASQTFQPYANYLRRLDTLRQTVLETGYDAFYLLIDESQTPEREPAETAIWLAPLLDGSLFDLEGLYVKLFVPGELAGAAERLCQTIDEPIVIAHLQWSEGDLADLLRALLLGAWGNGFSPFRAEELNRMTLLIPDIDRAFVRAVATNDPTPRGLLRLGQELFAQCARDWEPGNIVSISPDDWAGALRQWPRYLAAEELAHRPATLLPFRILFSHCTNNKATTHLIEPSRDDQPFRLPYKLADLWAILWALEHHARGIPCLSASDPHRAALERLGLIQKTKTLPRLVDDLLERVGGRLYDYVFRKPGLERWLDEQEKEATTFRSKGIDSRVWLELRFAHSATVLALFPWELLCRDGVFLLQTGHFELTRYPRVDTKEPALLLGRPFQLLYAAPRVDSVDLDRDQPRITRAFRSDGLLHLREIDPPTFERLQQEANGFKHQAFHYDDHGTFGRLCPECQRLIPSWQHTCPNGHPLPQPQGYLQFDDGCGHPDLRPAADILHSLYERGLQLAVVNACKSSAQAPEPTFGGTTPALIHARIPAAVGMLTSILDEAAGVFVSGFYETLSAALQSRHLSGQVAAHVLLQAMCEGRQRIRGDTDPVIRRSWWIPSLYLRYDRGEQT